MRRIAILTLAVNLAGCMVGPDYRRPALEMPPSYHFETKDVQKTAETAWWRQFRDPVLDDLVARALAGNKSVGIAAANIEQAAGVLTQVRSPFFPQVSYGASASRQRLSEKNASPVPSTVPNPRNLSSFSPAPVGKSTCGDTSADFPRLHGQTCSPRWRRAA